MFFFFVFFPLVFWELRRHNSFLHTKRISTLCCVKKFDEVVAFSETCSAGSPSPFARDKALAPSLRYGPCPRVRVQLQRMRPSRNLRPLRAVSWTQSDCLQPIVCITWSFSWSRSAHQWIGWKRYRSRPAFVIVMDFFFRSWPRKARK